MSFEQGRANLNGMEARSSVRKWLLLALAALVIQEALTTYPWAGVGPHAFWGGISLLLLFGVYRGRDLVRRVYLVISAIGVWVFAAALSSPVVSLAQAALFLAYLVQVGVMLLPAVRRWTGQHREVKDTPVAVR